MSEIFDVVAFFQTFIIFIVIAAVGWFFVTRFLVNVGGDEIALTERRFMGMS